MRHAIDPFGVLRAARVAIVEKPALWFRFSVSGTAPSAWEFPKAQLLTWRRAFRSFCEHLIALGYAGKIHFPVETRRKAAFYRRILAGLPIVVRRTIQKTKPHSLEILDGEHCAIRVGIGSLPCYSEINMVLAQGAAKSYRAAGVSAVVCPAVARDSKCGKCTACASPLVQLVIYPEHP
jgi:hypothetical protein